MNLTKICTPFALIVCVCCAGGCGSVRKAAADDSTNAPVAAVVKVARGNIGNTLEVASEFLPFQEVDVYAKVSGYIHKLNVDIGTHVKQGDELAVLEVPELQQQLQQDEASVRRSEQEIARAREELNRAQSAYMVAHLTYTRLADVQKSRPELVAQQEIDEAHGKDMEADAGVSSEKDALASAEQGLMAAKAALGKDQAMFDYTNMTAPFDGVITQIYAYTGALLPAGTSSSKSDSGLCRIAQNNLLRLVIPVPESAVPEIRIGSPVDVHVSVLNKSFKGTVARFADDVDLATRTMHTEIDVPNPKLDLVPGVYAEASITLDHKQNALTVPIQAIIRSDDRATVFTVDKENKIEERIVHLGIETPNQVEVVSGLTDGEMVVVGNRTQLRPGLLVQPKLAPEMPTVGGA